MNQKIFLTLCVTVILLLYSLPLFPENEKTFINKVVGGGFVESLIQTTDGKYAYLSGTSIATIGNVSGKRVSETRLLFEIPEYGYLTLTGIAETPKGFVAIGSGQLNGYYGPDTALIVAMDRQGKPLWNRTFSIIGSIEFDTAFATTDGGIIVAGGMYPGTYHPILMKFNSHGDIVWSIQFENLSYSFVAKPSRDGGLILAAQLFESETPDGATILKITESGDVLSAVNLKIKNFLIETLLSESDQRVLVVGRQIDHPDRLYMVSLNLDGRVHRKAAYALSVPNFDISNLIKTPDGGYAFAGALRRKSGSFYDGFLLKTDHRLKPVFQKRIGIQKSQEVVSSVIADGNGGYLLSGSSGIDTIFLGINKDGTVPGCGFTHNIDVTKIPIGNVIIEKSTVAPTVFFHPTPGSIAVTTKRIKRPISKVCGN